MVSVVGVRFRSAGKIYFFDPGEFEIHDEDGVIVETARGMEFGTVAGEIQEIRDDELISPLKKVIRLADEKDFAKHEENLAKKERTMAICQEKIEKHGLDMKLVDVEYTFDNSKVIFYFTSDGRVDFRELVKDLASVFKMRIELRQIGVRDVAKMLGGIGCCGKNLCCASWLSDFHPVSIKMAKVQNLSLNPTKISGVCGRLICCLKYENDLYVEMRKGMPETGERVKTKDGKAVVVDTNILENKVKVRLIEEEAGPDREEKLSLDIFTYTKEEVRRMGSRKKHHEKDIEEQLDAEQLAEIEKLMKE
ncbi:MAG: stage 0 sporulation family protein [Firmicutes bacterium]|nr:stage 0 sporulation family protein [Bacillota bacterium]